MDSPTTLPYDIARCDGRVASAVHGFFTVTVGQSECVRCRRREPGRPDGPQVYTTPPPFVDGKCPSRIEP